MSVGSLLQEADSAVVWRGPRKTALIKRFVKDTFWGRLDYLIFDILLMLFASPSVLIKDVAIGPAGSAYSCIGNVRACIALNPNRLPARPNTHFVN